MAAETLQRTLLIGVGQVGVDIVRLALARLRTHLGELPVIRGVGVTVEALPPEPALDLVQISPEGGPAAWLLEVAQAASQGLRAISHLDHLARLARQGVSLSRQDEVYVILVANPAESWLEPQLAELIQSLRQTVEETLGCVMSLSGLFVFVPPAGAAVSSHNLALPAAEFERGCFVAGLANEAGLLIGEVEALVERLAYFLAVLVRDGAGPGLTWLEAAPGGVLFTRVGVAWQRWPGRDLLEPLSFGWSQRLLSQVIRLPPSQGDPVRQARQAVQQWFTEERLAPPLLVDWLSELIPPLPISLADLAPDPPWPWLLDSVQAEVETAAQRWQEAWLAGRRRLQSTLGELQQLCPDQANLWVERQLAGTTEGALPLAQSYLAAVTELLLVFGEGVEQNLAEAEADLVQVEWQLGQIAAGLKLDLACLPMTPVRLVFQWGLRPRRWLSTWLLCRQVQRQLRHFAHLSRARLEVWHRVNLYELLLPFYRQFLADWQQRVTPWSQGWQQVAEAGRRLEGVDWEEQVETILQAAGGPWDSALVQALFRETVEGGGTSLWQQTGKPMAWVNVGLTADGMLEQLQQYMGEALTSYFLRPLDQLLCRQLPGEAAQSAWLKGLAEQALPFWPYDEAALAESARIQQYLEYWLFLPGGESSAVAGWGKKMFSPLALRPSSQPEELALITLRAMSE